MTEKDKKTILIIEDEATHIRVLTDTFIDSGFCVLSAVNGQEGLESALREQPDIILLDRVMPVMDGITMMKKLRESGSWGKSVPIILLTNLSIDEETKKILADIGDKQVDYIVKSDWTLSDIVKKVKEKFS